MKSLGFCLLLAMTAVATIRADDKTPDAEILTLRGRLKDLEAENKALREEVARLKGELAKVPASKEEEDRASAEIRRLTDLVKSFEKEPSNKELRQEIATLAKRLAKRWPSRVVWQALLKCETLKDGLSLREAEEILGPASDKVETRVGWYFNPSHRHVAPYLNAKVTKDGLAEWKIGNR